MSAAPVMDAANLMAFCAHEFEAFFNHIGGAIKQYQTTGQLPESLSKGSLPSHSTTGQQRTKPQRKPTAFNQFVKDKLQEFKATGVKLDDDKNGNLLFSLAVSEWKKLDDEAKQEYTRRYKANVEGTDLAEEQNSMPADLALPFSPGLAAGFSTGLSAALLGSAPIDPGLSAAAPQPLGDESDVATKKRKMREAEQQPLLQLGQSPLTQAPLSPASVGSGDKKHKKKKATGAE